MMKKYLALVAWSAGLLTLQAQIYSLDVVQKSGGSTVIPLEEFDRITFGEGNLIVKYEAGSTQSFPIQDIRKLQFSYASSLEEIADFSAQPYLYPNPATDYIYLKNFTGESLQVTIYSVNGPVLLQLQHADPAQAIDIQQLPTGIYLLRVNQHTLKFTKH